MRVITPRPRKKRRTNMTLLEKQVIKRLHNDGRSATQLAYDFNANYVTIWRALNDPAVTKKSFARFALN